MLSNRLDLTDRIAIEYGLSSGKTFKEIALKLGKSPSTVSREVKNNREFIRGSFFLGNDCRYARTCRKKHVCGDKFCGTYCIRCTRYDCRDGCISYKPYKCEKVNYSPYVCNRCPTRRDCFKNRYMYSAKFAQAQSDERLSSSRKGVRVDEKEIEILNSVLEKGIRKGQPLAHIYEQHKNELSVSLRSIYNYIDDDILSVKSIDLRRKVAYKKRRKPKNTNEKQQQYRIGRGYDEFQKFMLDNPNCPVIQMDTVKGRKEKGPVILTMLMLKYDIMLLFLLPENTASAVIDVFDFLTDILDLDVFQNLFPVILTDNGSEFKRVEELEYTCTGEQRCMMFYCDPMASWQKGELEKNHEYIRYVIPKGISLEAFTQEDMNLLMNHINSTKRPSLHGRCPYETVPEGDDDMLWLMELLKMDIIPADDVLLKPSLFKK